jgi:uncharacterized protein DUF4292
MKHFSWLIVTLGALITISSCRSTKKIQTVISTKRDTAQAIAIVDARADSVKYIRELYDNIQKNRIDFQTFSGKVKVKFEGDDGRNSDFVAYIKLKKDSALWVSINAVFGIEAFRALITPDSVKLVNKIDKVVQLRSVEYLQDVAKLPISFHELQDLLLGNPVYLDSNIVSYKKEEKTVSIIALGTLFKHLLTLSNNDLSLQYSKLDDVDATRNRTAYITYGGYETKDNYRFPTFRKITVSEKKKLDLEMQFRQWDFNGPLSFPFPIPKNFKRQ